MTETTTHERRPGAAPSHPARGVRTIVRESFRGRWFVQGVVLVALIQTSACAWLLSRSYFFAEDFTYLQIYHARHVDTELLREPIFGHLIPGFILLNKFFGSTFGADWAAAALLTVVVQLMGTVAFARLIHRLAGERWWTLWAVAAFALSIVGLNTSPWWAATTSIQIALAACVSVWGCVTRYASNRRVRHLVSLALMYAVALAFWEKSLATCAYLGLFALIVGFDRPSGPEDSGWRHRFRATVRLWPVWAIMGVLSAADLAVYVNGPYIDAARQSSGAGEMAVYLVRNVTEGLAPALWGIAYPTGADSASANPLLWIVPTALCLALVAWTSSRSALARRAWIWFVLADLCSQVLIARGRVGILGVDGTAHELRYQLDPTYLFLIALVIALPASVRASSALTRRRAVALVLILPMILAPIWAHSLDVISARSPGTASKEFFARLRAGDYARDAAFLDLPVPGWIVPPPMNPWNMSRLVLPLVRPGTKTTNDPTHALAIGMHGAIGPAILEPLPDSPSTARSCVGSQRRQRQILPAPSSVKPGSASLLLVRFDYDAQRQVRMRLLATTPTWGVNIRGDGSAFVLKPGKGSFAAVVTPPENWTGVSIRVPSGVSLCLSDVTYVQATG